MCVEWRAPGRDAGAPFSLFPASTVFYVPLDRQKPLNPQNILSSSLMGTKRNWETVTIITCCLHHHRSLNMSPKSLCSFPQKTTQSSQPKEHAMLTCYLILAPKEQRQTCWLNCLDHWVKSKDISLCSSHSIVGKMMSICLNFQEKNRYFTSRGLKENRMLLNIVIGGI